MELDRLADKLYEEHEHLDRILETTICDPSETNVALALSQARRVRRTSNIAVQELAKVRDQLQPKGGTS